VAADANRKSVKRRGQELSYRLRAMSRSKHRGGVHPNLSDQLAGADADEAEDAAAVRRQRRGKRRQSRHAALEQLTQAASLPVDVEAAAPPELQQLLESLQREVSAEEAAEAAASREAAAGRASIAGGGSLYDRPAALAYAAARMPACYAALEAALGEVAARRPGWRPASMLDFGAGPATAVWAAQRVWRQAPLDALAVEPAAGMAWLGGEIQERQRQAYEQAAAQRAAQRQAAGPAMEGRAGEEAGGGEEEEEEEEAAAAVPPPRLRWMYKLPPWYRGAQGRRYDLVTAGYVLGELRGEAERRRCVDELWRRTAPGGVLLLLEPGTPAGAGHIQAARRQLLEAARGAEGTQQQQQGQQQQGQGEAGGASAHVVAPCPHDGRCPLESRTAWCHFVQRFQASRGGSAVAATPCVLFVSCLSAVSPAIQAQAAPPLSRLPCSHPLRPACHPPLPAAANAAAAQRQGQRRHPAPHLPGRAVQLRGGGQVGAAAGAAPSCWALRGRQLHASFPPPPSPHQ
jgi:SAM-dependent methyltransferase